jgi:hypothetical protein
MPHATPQRRSPFGNAADPEWDAPADPGRADSAEALFAALLDGLEECYARDGMRGVIRIVLASAAFAPPPARTPGGRAAAAEHRPTDEPRSDDEVFRTLVATLEQAFLRDGLDGVVDALASIGRAMRYRASRRH